MSPARQSASKNKQFRRRIVIVDDHPVVAEGWASLIRAQLPCDILMATTALEGFRNWRSGRADLIIVDLALGDNKIGGIKLIERLRALDTHVPILVFTMNRSAVLGRRALHGGANGIVNKDAPTAEIIAAFQQVIEGGNYIDNRLATQIALMDVPGRNRNVTQLTAREEEVLGMIADGLSYREIADRACISYKTVTNVSLALRDKLGANNLASLVVKGIQHFEGSP